MKVTQRKEELRGVFIHSKRSSAKRSMMRLLEERRSEGIL